MLEFNDDAREKNFLVVMSIVKSLYPLHKSITGDGIDTAYNILQEKFDLLIHEYPSYSEVLSWKVPQSWRCDGVTVTHLVSGQESFNFCSPLRIASHSNAFSGKLLGSELKAHCKLSKNPNALLHQYLYYNDDWALSLTRDEYNSIIDGDEYYVKIDTEHYDGSLKVGELLHQGVSNDQIAFLSHLCHPAQFNDGLVGVLLNLYFYLLLKNKKTYYSYKFLFMPETIGSIAYCSNKKNTENIKSAIFTEMTALDQPLHIQQSANETDIINKYLKLADRELELSAKFSPFLSVIRNDEKVFNAPGINIPSASVTRALGREFDDHPYKNYHTNFDNIDNADMVKLNESLRFIETVIMLIESDRTVTRQFIGIPMLSKLGLFFDPSLDREKYDLSEKLVWLLEKPTTIADIAMKTNTKFQLIQKIILDWANVGLVKLEKKIEFT